MKNGEILRSMFNQMAVTTIYYKGEPIWLAHEVARYLGYKDVREPSRKIVSGDWSEDFDEPADYVLLKGRELKSFKALPEVGGEIHPTSNQALLLKEPGDSNDGEQEVGNNGHYEASGDADVSIWWSRRAEAEQGIHWCQAYSSAFWRQGGVKRA